MKTMNLSFAIPGKKSLTGIATSFALARGAVAQQAPPNSPVALPEPVLPLPTKAETPSETLRAAEANAVEKPAAPANAAAPAPAPAPNTARAVKGGILLNFQGAALSDVLN